MKKIFLVVVTFCMLLSFNANAGKNLNKNIIFNDFTPKTEISDHKNSQKLKTIQKFFSTKVGKWVLKKAIKKLQKKQLKNHSESSIKNDIKTKKATKNMAIAIFFSLGLLLLLGGIALIIGGYTVVGIILTVLGAGILLILGYILLLIKGAFNLFKSFK